MEDEPKLDKATLEYVLNELKEFHAKSKKGEMTIDRARYFEGVGDSIEIIRCIIDPERTRYF